jgi:hypothetical protein
LQVFLQQLAANSATASAFGQVIQELSEGSGGVQLPPEGAQVHALVEPLLIIACPPINDRICFSCKLTSVSLLSVSFFGFISMIFC